MIFRAASPDATAPTSPVPRLGGYRLSPERADCHRFGRLMPYAVREVSRDPATAAASPMAARVPGDQCAG